MPEKTGLPPKDLKGSTPPKPTDDKSKAAEAFRDTIADQSKADRHSHDRATPHFGTGGSTDGSISEIVLTSAGAGASSKVSASGTLEDSPAPTYDTVFVQQSVDLANDMARLDSSRECMAALGALAGINEDPDIPNPTLVVLEAPQAPSSITTNYAVVADLIYVSKHIFEGYGDQTNPNGFYKTLVKALADYSKAARGRSDAGYVKISIRSEDG